MLLQWHIPEEFLQGVLDVVKTVKSLKTGLKVPDNIS